MNKEDIDKLFNDYINKITHGKPHGVNRLDLHALTFAAGYEAGAKEFELKEAALEQKLAIAKEEIKKQLYLYGQGDDISVNALQVLLYKLND